MSDTSLDPVLMAKARRDFDAAQEELQRLKRKQREIDLEILRSPGALGDLWRRRFIEGKL